jgi:homogentisate 1,2-dioxygenase
MVRPGELVVIQRGMRFKVAFPDGPARGYIQEIFGSRFELPDLGPLGTHGLANPRDFETPVASFDVDQSPWRITYKYFVLSTSARDRADVLHATGYAAGSLPARRSTRPSMSLPGTESECRATSRRSYNSRDAATCPINMRSRTS